jgi:hypothetical protein
VKSDISPAPMKYLEPQFMHATVEAGAVIVK